MCRYDISGAEYTNWMEERTNQYNGLIRQAERFRRRRGVASKEEGQLYVEAAKVCQEIRDKNLSQQSTYSKWHQRYNDAMSKASQIADEVAPVSEPEPVPVRKQQPAARKPEPTPKPTPGQVAETASGFTTKNAVKDVPAETIEKWYKPKPNHSFDDVVGMEELKERLLQESASIGWTRTDAVLKIPSLRSYLFYGPPGTGKTFLIEAFASKLMEEYGFKFLQLNGGDIHQSLVGVAEKTVNIAFQEAIDNAPCIFFIDEIEGVLTGRGQKAKAEGHEKRLTVSFLEAYGKLKESKKWVVFMAATNYPGRIDEAWMDRMTARIRIPLPSEEAREAYFAREFDSLTLEDGFTFADMAEATDNYSYRDMENLRDTIASRLKNQAIESCRICSDGGSEDQEQADIAASEALKRGDVRLTRALFSDTQKELPPADKTDIRMELEEFEKNLTFRIE